MIKEEINEILKTGPVFFDTETTGLGITDQIVEISILDKDENVLFNSYVKPTVSIHPKASEVHGITEKELKNAPAWTEINDEIKAILENKVVVAYNSSFDVRLLRQTCQSYALDLTWVDNLSHFCAMEAAQQYLGLNRVSLINATKNLGIEWEGKAHSSISDTQMTVKLLNFIALNG